MRYVMKRFCSLLIILCAFFCAFNSYAIDVDAESLKTAIKNNNHAAAKALIEQGVDVNYRDDDGNPLLYTALIKNRLKMAKMLCCTPP